MNKAVAVKICKGCEKRHKQLFHLRPGKLTAIVGKIISVRNCFYIFINSVCGIFVINHIRYGNYVIRVAKIAQCIKKVIKIGHKAFILCLVSRKRNNFPGKLVTFCHILGHIFFYKRTFFIFYIETNIGDSFAVHAYHTAYKVSVAHHGSYGKAGGIRRCVFVISAPAFSVFIQP